MNNKNLLFTEMTAEEAAKVNGGGNFVSGFVDFWKNIWNASRKPNPYLPPK